MLALALLAGAVGVWRLRQVATARRRERERLAALRISLAEFDAMDDRNFEYALRDLLVRDGCAALRVGGAGDQAADVISDHPRLGRIVVQAKHTRVSGKVGSSVMCAVKGTAGPVHKAAHAVVVTNGTFTRDAMAWGDLYGIHWVDRDKLQQWAQDGAALHELLGLSVRSRPSRFKRAA
ncbi:restriction endonuclease [Streptomyces sp. NPDC055036]